MKPKDLVLLIVSAVILATVGTILVSNFGGATKKRTAEVEIVKPLDPKFDSTAKQRLLDTNTVHDFTVPIDLSTGLGNTNPFGQ